MIRVLILCAIVLSWVFVVLGAYRFGQLHPRIPAVECSQQSSGKIHYRRSRNDKLILMEAKFYKEHS